MKNSRMTSYPHPGFCNQFFSPSRYFLMTLALDVLYFGCTPGMPEQSSAAPALTKQQVKPLKVQEITSLGGITAWMIESREIPVVSFSMAFKNAGNASDPQGLTGLVSLLAGMLDEGAGEWNSQEFKKFLLEKNIQLSISASRDTFEIGFRTIKENVAEAFRVVQTILSKPQFEKHALNRVKNQLMTGLQQSLHDENSIAGKKLNSILYGSHPYGKTTEQAIKEFPAVQACDLQGFMKDRFARDQLFVSIVGAISPENAKKYLDETFANLPEKAVGSVVGDVALQNLGTVSVVPLDIPQSIVCFAQAGIPRNHPDFYASLVMMKILGDGQFESRLWNEVREKRGLAYGVDASLTWYRHSSLVSGSTATKNSSVGEVIDIIRSVWKTTLEGITQTELDFVKKRLIGSFALNFGSTNNISTALLSYQMDNLGTDYINTRNEIISSLTLEQINKAAQALLKPNQLTFVVVGQPDGLPVSQPGSSKIETGH